MRTRDDRGAAAPEYIAILLIAAMFTSAVAVGVKPEWVQQKVCQALAAVSYTHLTLPTKRIV